MTKKQQSKVVEPQVGTRVIKVKLQGASDMLMHRPDPATIEGKNKSSGEPDRSMYWRDVALYYDKPTGLVYFPSTWIERSMVKAAVDFKIKGQGKKTYKQLIMSTVFVGSEKIYFTPQIKVEDFENPKNNRVSVDERIVVNPSSRGRVLRSRPKFHAGWVCEFELHCIEEGLPLEVLHEIVKYAGSRIGLGDYRPKFGRFAVASFEVIQDFTREVCEAAV